MIAWFSVELAKNVGGETPGLACARSRVIAPRFKTRPFERTSARPSSDRKSLGFRNSSAQ